MAMEVFKLVGRITYEGQKKVEAGLTKLGQKVEAAEEKLASFGDKAQAVGQKTADIGGSLTQNVSLPLMALGGLGIKAANDIDTAFGKLAATTDRTKQDTAELQEAAKNLWKNAYGQDVYEAADAVAIVDRNLGDLAANAQEIEKVTEAAFVLKDAFGYEIQESSRAAAALMNNFGIEGQAAMDMIATAAQKGGDYSQELIDTVNEYSTYFGAAGFSAEQMFDTLLAGAKNGAWNMDKVGDSVKEFNIRAKDGSKTTAEGFAAIGFNADEMAVKIAEGGETGHKAFMATIAALSQMDDKVAMNQAGVSLFGTQWEDLESTVMQAMGNSEGYLGEFQGKTNEMSKELYDNFGTRLTEAMRRFQDALIPLGNILITMVEPAIDKLSTGAEKLANWFGSLTSSQQKWIVILGIAAAAIGPLLVVVGTLISSVGAIATAIAGIGLVTVGWIAGIGLLVAALAIAYAKFEWFRNGVNSVFAFIVSIVKPIILDFVEFFKMKIAEMVAWWDQNGAMIMQAFQNVWSVIQTVIKTAVSILMPIVQGFINGIKNIISGGLDIIMGLVEFFAALFTGNWSKMFEAVKKILGGALQLIWGLFEAGFMGRIFGVLKLFVSKAGGAVSGFVSKITGFFTNMGSKAKGIFTDMVDTVKLKVMYGFDKVKSAIMKPIETAVNFVKRQVAKIAGFFSGLKIKLPKIKLPHFSLKGKFSLAPPSVPKLGVDWYKKGGVFGGPSVIGVGEEPGVSEAVVPLKKSVLAQIGEGIAAAGGNNRGGGDSKPIIVQLMLQDMRILAEALVDPLDKELQSRKGENDRAGGKSYL
jgi:phage-related minor tail protein